MNTLIYIAGALIAAGLAAALTRRRKFVVPEGHYGLLYRNQKYRHRISPGRHCFWSRDYSVRLVDMRKLKLPVAGREVASADKVGVKINALLTYQIIQAETAVHAVQDYLACLDSAVQAALGSVMVITPIEALLNRRPEINKQLHILVLPEADKIGITIHAVEVEEVMVPGGLARIATALGTQS
jgi:regulator of protease activity HflC (stomatin/prohibitin superfamily)